MYASEKDRSVQLPAHRPSPSKLVTYSCTPRIHAGATHTHLHHPPHGVVLVFDVRQFVRNAVSVGWCERQVLLVRVNGALAEIEDINMIQSANIQTILVRT